MIFTPSEYTVLLEGIPKSKNQVKFKFQLETMLNTGMRYVELQRFDEHSEWFDIKNRLIALPTGSTLKLGGEKGRDVHLTPAYTAKLEMYLSLNELKFPSREVMEENLKRWWIRAVEDTNRTVPIIFNIHVTPKTFRYTLVTWLLAVYGENYMKANDIWKSMGHSGTVSMNHYYAGRARLKSCIDEVKKFVEGWGT